jgi:hypothetical protein
MANRYDREHNKGRDHCARLLVIFRILNCEPLSSELDIQSVER